MTELGDLLELLVTAHRRYRTVRATVRLWHDRERARRAFAAWARESRISGTGDFLLGGEPLAETDATIRLWLEQPGRRREEHDEQGNPEAAHVTVTDGDTWWMYSAGWGAMWNEGDPGHGAGTAVGCLLDPRPIVAGFDLEVIGRVRHRGREAIRLRAIADDTEERYFHELPFGADEHELLVDVERGVVLHVLSRFEGEPFALTEVLEIAFDEALPPETFVFTPPPGEVLRSARTPDHTEVRIDEAARLAPFRVFVPARLPGGWSGRVMYLAGENRPALETAVIVRYTPEDARHHLTLHETAAGSEPAPFGPLERVERDGQELLVWTPDEEDWPMPAQVVVEREGTRVQLTSDLPLETVLDLAVSLVPAPTEPLPLP